MSKKRDLFEEIMDGFDALRKERERDTERLYWLVVEDGCFDVMGGIDVHEEAAINASAFGREEPNRDDYIAAIRTVIDMARKESA